jgi:hypothetical protein
MKLKRKLKSRKIIIDLSNPNDPNLWYENEYEDVLIEPFYKLVLKHPIFWINLSVILLNMVSLLLTTDKIILACNGLLVTVFCVYLTAFIIFAWKEYNQ